MGREGDSRDSRCEPDRYRDDQSERQSNAEQHSGGGAERSNTHRVPAPRTLEREDKQANSGRSNHAMNDTQERLPLTTQIQQRQGHAQRHRAGDCPGSGADYARTPKERRRAMSSVA
jgi:hypothetical protein